MMITLAPVHNLYPGLKIVSIAAAWKAGHGWDIIYKRGRESELMAEIESLKSLGFSKVQLHLMRTDRNSSPFGSDFSIEELSNSNSKL